MNIKHSVERVLISLLTTLNPLVCKCHQVFINDSCQHNNLPTQVDSETTLFLGWIAQFSLAV